MSRSNSPEQSSDSGHQGPKTSQKTAKAGRTPPPPPPPDVQNGKPERGEAVAIKGSAGIQAPEPDIPASQQASSSGQSTPLIIVSSKPDLVINNTPNNFIGGKAGFHLSTWKSITSDSWILSQIEGVFPEFDSPPHQEKPPQPIIWSDTEKLALALEIESLKNQQVISETKNHQENEILSNIFLRRKPNGTYRAILNLKPLNQFVHYPTILQSYKAVFLHCWK